MPDKPHPCPMCASLVRLKPRGRPAMYCDSDCRDLFKYLGAVRDLTDKIKDKMVTAEGGTAAAKRLRGELFRIGNQLNRIQGIAVGLEP